MHGALLDGLYGCHGGRRHEAANEREYQGDAFGVKCVARARDRGLGESHAVNANNSILT